MYFTTLSPTILGRFLRFQVNASLQLLVSPKIPPCHMKTSGFCIAHHQMSYLYELYENPSGFLFLVSKFSNQNVSSFHPCNFLVEMPTIKITENNTLRSFCFLKLLEYKKTQYNFAFAGTKKLKP